MCIWQEHNKSKACSLIGQLAIYHWPVGAHQEKLAKIQQLSSPVRLKCTDEVYKWKVEVDENTQLSFWRKVKRSGDKFALEKFITVFFAARSSEEKPSEWIFKDLSPRLRYVLCVFLEEKVCFEMEMDQLALYYWLFSQVYPTFKYLF